MKNTILVAFFGILFLVSCNKSSTIDTNVNQEEIMNSSIKELYENDQKDRMDSDLKWTTIAKRDELRRERAIQLLDSNKIQTGKDYYRTAMLFQHGDKPEDYKKAIDLMEIAIEKDTTISKWLFAAATDRYLLSINKPQIYGTQYTRIDNGKWKLENYDTTAVDNKTRMEYRVGTVKQQYLKLDKMNSEFEK